MATKNFRTLSPAAGYVEVVLRKCRANECCHLTARDKSTRRNVLDCRRMPRLLLRGGSGEKEKLGSTGLDRRSGTKRTAWTRALSSKRLMSMTFDPAGKSKASTFVAVYAALQTRLGPGEEQDTFWTEFDRKHCELNFQQTTAFLF